MYNVTMPKLFEIASQRFINTSLPNIDFHTYFKQFNKEHDLFRDKVHFNENGESIVAEKIFNFIMDDFNNEF